MRESELLWMALVGLLVVALVMVAGCHGGFMFPVPDYQQMLDEAIATGVPGGVLLVRTPNIYFLGTSGYSDLEARTPMRTDQLSRIASCTKTFIGVLAATLHFEGVLDLDARIAEHLPVSVTERVANADRASVRQCLEHTTGIPEYGDMDFVDAVLADPTHRWTDLEAVEFAYDEPALFEPGTQWRYSNTNYLLAGLCMDAALGYHHSIALRDKVLQPLGLNGTYYGPDAHYEQSRLTHGYLYDAEADTHSDFTDINFGEWLANGGMVSTVEDLGRFIRAVFQNPTFPRIVQPGHTKSAFLQELLPRQYDYGLGIGDVSGPLGRAYGHSGDLPGYRAYMYHYPDRDATFVLFLNERSGRVEQVAQDLLIQAIGETLGTGAGADGLALGRFHWGCFASHRSLLRKLPACCVQPASPGGRSTSPSQPPSSAAAPANLLPQALFRAYSRIDPRNAQNGTLVVLMAPLYVLAKHRQDRRL